MTLNELESARLEYLAAEKRWRSLLHQQQIAENSALVGKFFDSMDEDRDYRRYIYVRSIDVFGNMLGDTISIYDDSDIRLEFNTIVKRSVIESADEITASDFVTILSKLNATITRIMEQLS